MHAYSKAGVYQVKLSAGDVSFTKSLKIYPGTVSYQVFNQVSAALPLVSFGVNSSSDIENLIEHGTLATNAKSDTVFTSHTQIYLGGYIGSQIFIAVTPYAINKFGHHSLVINNNTQIYTGTTYVSASVLNMRGTTGKTLNNCSSKIKLSILLN